MNFKDLLGVAGIVYGWAAQAIGTAAITLFLLSLYPPLSFIPKFFVLFVLTH